MSLASDLRELADLLDNNPGLEVSRDEVACEMIISGYTEVERPVMTWVCPESILRAS